MVPNAVEGTCPSQVPCPPCSSLVVFTRGTGISTPRGTHFEGRCQLALNYRIPSGPAAGSNIVRTKLLQLDSTCAFSIIRLVDTSNQHF